MATKRPVGKKKSITLRDVVVHLQSMEQRLSKDIQNVDKRLTDVETRLTGLIRRVETRLTDVEERLTARISALEDDLTATMWDTVKIRKHVGMALPDEE